MKSLALVCVFALVACNPYAALIPKATFTRGPGCSMELDVYEASGAKFRVSLDHYAQCPAPVGATSHTIDGVTYIVEWDRHER